MILLEFINSISANIGMANPSYLVGREMSTLSVTLHIWHPVIAGIKLFLIVLSRSSSKWRMYGIVLGK